MCVNATPELQGRFSPLDCLIVVSVVFRVAANQKVFVSYGSWTDSPCDLGGRPHQRQSMLTL